MIGFIFHCDVTHCPQTRCDTPTVSEMDPDLLIMSLLLQFCCCVSQSTYSQTVHRCVTIDWGIQFDKCSAIHKISSVALLAFVCFPTEHQRYVEFAMVRRLGTSYQSVPSIDGCEYWYAIPVLYSLFLGCLVPTWQPPNRCHGCGPTIHSFDIFGSRKHHPQAPPTTQVEGAVTGLSVCISVTSSGLLTQVRPRWEPDVWGGPPSMHGSHSTLLTRPRPPGRLQSQLQGVPHSQWIGGRQQSAYPTGHDVPREHDH